MDKIHASRTGAVRLSTNALKLIAIAAMTLDHLTWTLRPGFDPGTVPILLHCIGRLTAPIMFYFVAEGYHHTRDVRKYAQRLFLFAIPSHFAYAVCFKGTYIPFRSGEFFGQTSVIWGLLWGLIALAVVRSDHPALSPVIKAAVFLFSILISLPADWSGAAPAAIVLIGLSRGNYRRQMLGIFIPVALYAAGYALLIDRTYGLIQLAVVLSFPLLRMYDGTLGYQHRKRGRLKWFFYIYYPLHMTILGLFKMFYLER